MSADLQVPPRHQKVHSEDITVDSLNNNADNTPSNVGFSKSTDISVNARINYNLRFTKQAVLVLGQHSEQYSQLASEFLVNLSNNSINKTNKLRDNQLNVAFVAASNQLDDIQIRCRLIEQLFANKLFDPEQPLSVSIINFAIEQKQAISIVIDHAQALSLQLKYELCALVNIAKKNKLIINLVMFGLTYAGNEIAGDKELFKNKITLIDASSGQVISLSDKRILDDVSMVAFTNKQKFVFIGAMSLVAAALVWLYLLIAADIQKTVFTNEDPNFQVDTSILNSTTKRVTQDPTSSTTEFQQRKSINTTKNVKAVNNEEVATSHDIYQALLNRNLPIKKVLPANSNDILQALAKVNTNTPRVIVSVAKTVVLKQQKQANNKQYYFESHKQLPRGYVIQIAAFNDMKSTLNFLALHKKQALHWYKKEVNNQTYIIVTSPTFKNAVDAKKKLASMPRSLLLRNPWIKSISSIIEEINTLTQ
jgi:DamX protein